VKLWMPAAGGEVFHAQDMKVCCRDETRYAEGYFECALCGTTWQPAMRLEPEEYEFVSRAHEDKRRAA
jgi:hypothetical protein